MADAPTHLRLTEHDPRKFTAPVDDSSSDVARSRVTRAFPVSVRLDRDFLIAAVQHTMRLLRDTRASPIESEAEAAHLDALTGHFHGFVDYLQRQPQGSISVSLYPDDGEVASRLAEIDQARHDFDPGDLPFE